MLFLRGILLFSCISLGSIWLSWLPYLFALRKYFDCFVFCFRVICSGHLVLFWFAFHSLFDVLNFSTINYLCILVCFIKEYVSKFMRLTNDYVGIVLAGPNGHTCVLAIISVQVLGCNVLHSSVLWRYEQYYLT